MQDAGLAQDTTGIAAQISSATESVVDKVVGWMTAAVTMLPNLVMAVLVLLAGVGILGLALGFAFQDIASNFVSGVLLAFRRPFQVGDLIESNDLFGQVEQMNLRATLLRQFSGQIVCVPNKDIFTNPIVHFSALGERRVEVDVGGSYNDDLEHARQVALEAIEAIPLRKQDRPVAGYYKEFSDSSINFVLHFWIDFTSKQSDSLEAQSQAVMRIKAASTGKASPSRSRFAPSTWGTTCNPSSRCSHPVRPAGDGDREPSS